MWYESLLERNLIPDFLIRFAIRKQLQNKQKIESQNFSLNSFVQQLKQSPLAVSTREANEQHYELPPEFFDKVLGKCKKYSSGYWDSEDASLDESEEAMLEKYVQRAQVKDGMKILDLGCGWGSLSLYLAEKFPNAKIVGVSNSKDQKRDILTKAKKKDLKNIEIITCDMNDLDLNATFDLVCSIEMFEHMRNYEVLFRKIGSWLKPEGSLFVHIFCHENLAYFFDDSDPSNWMARYFFTGGVMPSKDLFRSFDEDLYVAKNWMVNGKHYQKTCEAWLCKMDQSKSEIMSIFEKTYGKANALKWWVYWRVFFMACAELFGFNEGKDWQVAHYLFKPTLNRVKQEV